MIPALPAKAIGLALDAGEWDLAAELLGDHEREVRDTLSTNAPSSETRASWLKLLSAQREMLSQLQTARSETAQTLEKMGRDQRGIKSYLAAG